jgi:hypothetical protein
LMMNNNWSGFVMDGSEENMKSLQKRSWFFRYDLNCKAAWIDKDNINSLLAGSGYLNIGLLHIDLDGNDYHILTALDFSKLNPSILVLEYNSRFGSERAITIPYDKNFSWTKAHYSNLFFGASLQALNYAAERKGYALVGCNLAGNNAYFVRTDLLNQKIKKIEVSQAFRSAKFRQARNKEYKLSLLPMEDELNLIKGLTVLNVTNDNLEII